MTRRRFIVSPNLSVLVAIAASISGNQGAFAQEFPADLKADPAAIQEKPEAHLQGVYLDDSFEANELIADIREMADRGEWKQALAKLEELLDQFSGKVTRWDDDIYISVQSFINREIAGWPAEGLKAYRGQFEPRAKLVFDAALEDHDIEQLSRLFGTYFCTSTALRAGDTLAQIFLEAGQFSQAQSIYEQLLNIHPDRDLNNLEWHSRIALCLALNGQTDSSRKLLEQVGPSLQQHPIAWKGRHEACQNVIAEIESNPVIASPPPKPIEWSGRALPLPGGGDNRSMLPQMDALPTAPLWTFDDFSPSTLSRAEGYYQSSSFRSAYAKGKFLALQPVVSQGLVFLHDALRVWALRQDTGTLAWSYQGVTFDGQDTGWGDRSVPLFHSCTAYNDRLYVELGSQPMSYYGYSGDPAGPHNQSVLVCLDAHSGRLIWKISPGDYGEDPREVQFEGPVVADEHGIYIVVRRRKPFGFEDCYLWKFSDGGQRSSLPNLEWRTHLGSASTGGFGYRRPTLAIPTLVDSAICVQTNLGTVALVDIVTGLVKWIRVYDRQKVSQHDRWQRSTTEQSYPWQYNPVLHCPSRSLTVASLLLAMPLDIEDLLLINRRTGVIEDRIPKSGLFQVESLLSVVDGRLYGVGEKVFSWNISSREMVWSEPLGDNTLYGRATLSQSHVFVPCRTGLLAYPLSGGDPTVMNWDPTKEGGSASGGNVVVLEGKGEGKDDLCPTSPTILVAGNERITCYGLRENVFARLQEQMNRNPSDPLPALKLAEVAYRTATSARRQPPGSQKQTDYELGRQALAQAVQRAGGFAAPLEPELKERLFQDCLLFAEFHLKGLPPDLDRAIELLIMAGQCPPDREKLLSQKDKLAAAYALKPDYTNVIRQYHQILLDRSLHDLPWPGPEEEGQTSQLVCRRRIANLIAEHGRGIYKPFDEKAATLLAAGIEANDLRRLDQIIEAMPNSLAAPKALIAKGLILRDRRQQPVSGARCFYAALTRYSKQIDPAETIRQLADCYVQAGRPAIAWQWLSKAARELPGARVHHQGQRLSFLQYRELLGDVGHLSSHQRPRIRSELKEGYVLKTGDEDRLLYPVFRQRRDSDWSKFLMHNHDGVTAHESTTGKALWAEPLSIGQKPQLLASLADLIILATRFEILGLNPADGKVRWHFGERPQKVDDPQTDPECFSNWQIHQLYENRLVSSRDDALTVCIDIRTGQLIWKRDLEQKPAQTLSVGENIILYCTASGNRQICPVLSADDGRLQQIIELQDNPVLDIVQTHAGNAVLVTAQSLIAVDPLTGRIEWQSEFENNLLLDTVHVVLDGIILSADGTHIVKLNLDSGGLMWQSDAIQHRPAELNLIVADDELYAFTEKSVWALDPVSGRTLGHTLVPPDTHLVHVEPADQNLVLICRFSPGEEMPMEYSTFLAPRPAQADRRLNQDHFRRLGQFRGAIHFYCFDHAIIGLSEKTLLGWVDSSDYTQRHQ